MIWIISGAILFILIFLSGVCLSLVSKENKNNYISKQILSYIEKPEPKGFDGDLTGLINYSADNPVDYQF